MLRGALPSLPSPGFTFLLHDIFMFTLLSPLSLYAKISIVSLAGIMELNNEMNRNHKGEL